MNRNKDTSSRKVPRISRKKQNTSPPQAGQYKDEPENTKETEADFGLRFELQVAVFKVPQRHLNPLTSYSYSSSRSWLAGHTWPPDHALMMVFNEERSSLDWVQAGVHDSCTDASAIISGHVKGHTSLSTH